MCGWIERCGSLVARLAGESVMTGLVMAAWLALSLPGIFPGLKTSSALAEPVGKPASPTLIGKLDRDARHDGAGLPPGSGGVSRGEEIYAQKCAACHGEFGEGQGRFPALIGGEGTLATDSPRRTIGSFWPHAPTVFDYVWRSMPFGHAFVMAPDEVYALTAYILNINGIVDDDFIASAKTLPRVKMPNRDGFDMPPHPPAQGTRCMHDCRATPRVIMRAPRAADGETEGANP